MALYKSDVEVLVRCESISNVKECISYSNFMRKLFIKQECMYNKIILLHFCMSLKHYSLPHGNETI